MALEYYTVSSGQECLDLLQEKLENDNTHFKLASNSNAVIFYGTLWNSTLMLETQNTIIAPANSSLNIFLDIEHHFLLIQSGNFISGEFKTNDQLQYTFGSSAYIETNEQNQPFFYCTTSPIDGVANNIFGSGVTNPSLSANISNLFNVTQLSAISSSMDLGDNFELVPAYIGVTKLKRLFVCLNNKCSIGRIVTTGDKRFKCVGRQVFYEITEE